MNKERRKELSAIAAALKLIEGIDTRDGLVAVKEQLETLDSQLEGIQEGENNAFENLTEGLQASRQDQNDEFNEAMESAMDNLKMLIDPDDAIDSDDIEQALENIYCGIDSAAQ